jgi:cytochrome bd-type quinol oxidase subunit 1
VIYSHAGEIKYDRVERLNQYMNGSVVATITFLLAVAVLGTLALRFYLKRNRRDLMELEAELEEQEKMQEAYFVFDCPPDKETFIFKLTDPARIQEARDILNGKSTKKSVMGIIVKQPAQYNPPWSYHLDPQTITFFEIAIEVCDASIQYVEDHLSEVGGSFLPDSRWCPWCSRLIKEVY